MEGMEFEVQDMTSLKKGWKLPVPIILQIVQLAHLKWTRIVMRMIRCRYCDEIKLQCNAACCVKLHHGCAKVGVKPCPGCAGCVRLKALLRSIDVKLRLEPTIFDWSGKQVMSTNIKYYISAGKKFESLASGRYWK